MLFIAELSKNRAAELHQDKFRDTDLDMTPRKLREKENLRIPTKEEVEEDVRIEHDEGKHVCPSGCAHCHRRALCSASAPGSPAVSFVCTSYRSLFRTSTGTSSGPVVPFGRSYQTMPSVMFRKSRNT